MLSFNGFRKRFLGRISGAENQPPILPYHALTGKPKTENKGSEYKYPHSGGYLYSDPNYLRRVFLL
jgi:hypothetical protein